MVEVWKIKNENRKREIKNRPNESYYWHISQNIGEGDNINIEFIKIKLYELLHYSEFKVEKY